MHLYKIKCLTTDDFYIGSTCNFKKRTYKHKSELNVRKRNNKLYDFMRINGGLDNFKFEILFTFNNITRKELLIKENELITDLKPTLNAIKSYNTKEDKLKRDRENSKKYKEKYPEKVKKYQAEYRKAHPEKIKKYQAEYHKKYQAEYNKKRVLCDCGKTISLHGKARHLKTKYHSEHSMHLPGLPRS